MKNTEKLPTADWPPYTGSKYHRKDNTMDKTAKKKPSLILILIFIVALAVFSYSAYRIYLIWASTSESKEVTGDLQEKVVIEMPEEKEEEKKEDAVPVIDWDAALAENEDIIGWIYQPDTVINYPILHGKDNDQYLHTLIDGTANSHGSLFIDYRCQSDFSDTNTVIYGHHMKDGTMFGSIVGYQDQKYYEEHPVMYLLTPEQNYRIELIGGYVAEDNAPIYDLPSEEGERADIIKTAQQDSTFQSTTEVGKKSKLVTLSTCSYEFENARYVLIGQLTKLKEE